jgi:flagellar biosynthesis protein FlhG
VTPFDHQTHYEVLEIRLDASQEDVERAYRMALSTYGDDSMAVYSLLGEEEVSGARERVELAYEVLSDSTARQRYDAQIGADGWEGHEAFEQRIEMDDLPGDVQELMLPVETEPDPAANTPRTAQQLLTLQGVEAAGDDEDTEDGVYDGPRLRRARLSRGVEVAQIAQLTKVNPTYLHFIEEERFDDLPATVYVRGFVAAYARALGLDAHDVPLSYVERLEQHRDAGAGRRR